MKGRRNPISTVKVYIVRLQVYGNTYILTCTVQRPQAFQRNQLPEAISCYIFTAEHKIVVNDTLLPYFTCRTSVAHTTLRDVQIKLYTELYS